MRVNVGDVVLIKYRTFKDVLTTGLFVVIYHECYDEPTSINFTGIKIATDEYCYQVPLQAQYLTFLDHDSFLNVNAQFRFIEDQVFKIVGRLSPYYLNKLLQQQRNYNKRIESQLIDTIGEQNLFEYNKKEI